MEGAAGFRPKVLTLALGFDDQDKACTVSLEWVHEEDQYSG